MPIQAQTPDGAIHEFPDGTPDGVIDGAIKSYLQPAPTYSGNVSKDMTDSMGKIGGIWQQGMAGQINPASAGVRMLGAAAQGALSPVTEAIPEAVKQPMARAASAIANNAPDFLKPSAIAADADTKPWGRQLGDYLMNSPNARAMLEGTGENAKALGNILSVAPVGETANAVTRPVGNMLYDSGKASQDAAHQAYIEDLVLPKQTQGVKADMAMRTNQVKGTNVYQPTAQEQQMASTVASIPGVGKSNSVQKNLSLIQQANTQEAEALKAKLQQSNVPIADDTILNSLSSVRNDLAKNPYISGVDGSKAAESVVNNALDIISKKPQTAAGMLEARKELDQLVASQKGDKTFNPALDSPITIAVQKVRGAMNDMVANAVPSADVKASLAKQSNLYAAADNIAPKAAGEAATRMGRAMQAVMPHSVKEAAGDIGKLGAATMAYHMLPTSALLGGAAGYGLYKGATAPATRIMLGKMLGSG